MADRARRAAPSNRPGRRDPPPRRCRRAACRRGACRPRRGAARRQRTARPRTPRRRRHDELRRVRPARTAAATARPPAKKSANTKTPPTRKRNGRRDRRRRMPGPRYGGHGSLRGHHGGRAVAAPVRPHDSAHPIADAVDGLDIPRVARIGLDLAADVLDVRVDGALERLDVGAAHGVEQLGAREHAAGLPRQRGQQLELRRREIDRLCRRA